MLIFRGETITYPLGNGKSSSSNNALGADNVWQEAIDYHHLRMFASSIPLEKYRHGFAVNDELMITHSIRLPL